MRSGSPAKSGNEPKALGHFLTGESAGCEALRAEWPVDEVRSALLPGAKRPATIVASQAQVYERPCANRG
jgi:hypothetical protein